MEEKQGRRRRAFSEEYKAEVVDLCRSGGRSIGQVARDLDLTETAVRRWVRLRMSRSSRNTRFSLRRWRSSSRSAVVRPSRCLPAGLSSSLQSPIYCRTRDTWRCHLNAVALDLVLCFKHERVVSRNNLARSTALSSNFSPDPTASPTAKPPSPSMSPSTTASASTSTSASSLRRSSRSGISSHQNS